MTGKIKIVAALILFALMISITNIIYQPTGQVMSQWELKEVGSNELAREITMPYTQDISEPGIYEFSTVVTPDNMKSDIINIRRINTYAFEVVFNGHIIYSQGNMDVPTGNLWNRSFLIKIPPGLMEAHNRIVIRTYGLHDIGFIMPPTLGLGADAYQKVDLQNFISGGMSHMMGGANLFTGILLIAIGINQRKKMKYYISLGISFVMIFIYSFEYIYREYTASVSSYLWVRKILMLSAILAIGFLARGLYGFIYSREINKRLSYGFCLSLIGMVIMPTYHMLHRAMAYYNMLSILILFVIIIGVFKSGKTSLYFSVSFLMSTTLHTFIIYVFGIYKLTYWNYGVSVLFIGITYNLVVEFDLLHTQNKELDFRASIDALTGAYNRNFLESVTKDYSILIFLDVDKFKQYNDTLGHHQGDLLLQGLVESINNTIKDNGIVIRYGGDEFVIFLKNMTTAMAKAKIKDVQDFMKETYSNIDISYGINPITDDINKVLQATDKKMYDMKESKC